VGFLLMNISCALTLAILIKFSFPLK
jgi:hypothetical protein